MAIAEQIKSDLTAAMRAGERERVTALRLLLSELQKDAKDGGSDELAVLRRERKRRNDAAEAFRAAARGELAEQEEREAELIAGYLPAALSDEALAELIDRVIAEIGAGTPADMGRTMKAVMSAAEGRADGARVSARVRAALAG